MRSGAKTSRAPNIPAGENNPTQDPRSLYFPQTFHQSLPLTCVETHGMHGYITVVDTPRETRTEYEHGNLGSSCRRTWKAFTRRRTSSTLRPTGKSLMVIWRRMPVGEMMNRALQS
eukprot:1157569-Pelagomonas_calceolata.AAC.3